MEHAMHACLALILLLTALKFLYNPADRTLFFMCIAGVLAVAARYESLFLTAPLCAWLICTRQYKAGIALIMTSFFPVFLYGVFSMLNGSFFLPNSLMLKGTFPSVGGVKQLIQTLGGRGFSILTTSAHLFVISILLLLGILLYRKKDCQLSVGALCLVCSMLLHLQFASTGWFYRYEAYLIAVSLPILGGLYSGIWESLSPRTSCKYKWTKWGALFLCSLLLPLWPLHRRAKKSLEQVVPASHHIYRQQYQMGQFLRQMYPSGVRVALNDLGAVAYYSDSDILDLFGLGTIEVARAKLKGEYNSETLLRLLERHQTQVIMIYSNWFTGKWPDHLFQVAEWTTTRNYFNKTVTFYALSKEAVKDTEERLRQYQEALPKSVEVKYFNTKPSAAAYGLPHATEP